MPLCDVVNNSVIYTVALRSNFPPPLEVVYLKINYVPYMRMVGTKYCLESGRPDKMFMNIEFNDVNMDLYVSTCRV